MKFNATKRLLAASIFTSLMHCAPAYAKTPASIQAEPTTKYRAGIYLWGAGIKGTTAGGQSIDVSFNDILRKLQFGFMGTVEARRDKWSFLADAIYLHINADKSSSIALGIPGININGNANTDLRGLVLNLVGGYNVYNSQQFMTDIVAGARYLHLDSENNLRLDAPGRTRAVKVNLSGNSWDGVVGAKGVIRLNNRWAIPYYADIGTGESDFTWQALAGIRYGYNWGSVNLVYRHLSWRLKSDTNLNDIAFSGPMLGFVFNLN